MRILIFYLIEKQIDTIILFLNNKTTEKIPATIPNSITTLICFLIEKQIDTCFVFE